MGKGVQPHFYIGEFPICDENTHRVGEGVVWKLYKSALANSWIALALSYNLAQGLNMFSFFAGMRGWCCARLRKFLHRQCQMYHKLADRDVDHPGMLITHKSQHSHTKHVFIFLT